MSTEPHVAIGIDELPRQAQNLAPGVEMPPPRSGGWRADRPGDLRGGQPTGPLLGSPGPNVGYALRLAAQARDRFALAPDEHLEDAIAVVAALAMKRAASFGRAPVMTDIECALLVLGYQGGCEPGFATWRAMQVAGAGHDYSHQRALCDAVDLDALRLPPAALAARASEVRTSLQASSTPMPE
jgi:hypothetical protein